jgi:hypothetical protein
VCLNCLPRGRLGLTAFAPRRVAQIDAHIASLEHTIAFLKIERTNIRRKSGSRHPLFTPELLASIIEWGIFMRAFEPDDVMAVSTFWRQVVRQTPALWSRIIMTDLPSQEHIAPRMKRFLEQSKDHALHIELSVSDSTWRAWRYEETLDALAKLLRPHMRRCVYFSLGRGFDSVTMLQLVIELNPDIEYISLSEGFLFGGQNDVLIGSLRVRDQKAAHLTCIRGPLPYTVFIGIHFPVLRHLELTDEAPVEWEMILDLLTHTPFLRTLIIARQELQLTAHSNLTLVVLPRLTTLRLIEWSAENLNLFFTYVSTPDLQELALLKTPAHAFPLDLIKQVKKLELPANSATGWTARVLRNAIEVEELTMTSTTATREVLELLANQSEGIANVQHGLRAWVVPKMTRLEMDCFSASGYNRIPVQELRGVLRRRRLGGVQEISKLSLHGVEENEIEHLKGELDGEVERLEVLPQSRAALSGTARSWLPRRRRRHHSPPIIITGPRSPRQLPYIPGRPMRHRSRSWSRSPSPRIYPPSRHRSQESVIAAPPPLPRLPPLIIGPFATPAAVPADRSVSSFSSPERYRQEPSPTESPRIISPDERQRGRFRVRRRTPTIRSQSTSPPILSPVVITQVSQNSLREEGRRDDEFVMRPPLSIPIQHGVNIIPEAPSFHLLPPQQPVTIVQDDSEDGPRGFTTFGRMLSNGSYGSSPQFSPHHPSPRYTPHRRSIQFMTSPPRSPHPAFPSAQGLRTEEFAPHYNFSYPQLATPPAIAPWLTHPSVPPSPPALHIQQQPSVWVEPSSVERQPRSRGSFAEVSLPHRERQGPHAVNGPLPWVNGPAYDHHMNGVIPNTTLLSAIQPSPEPFVVQVPSRSSNRVIARAVRRITTTPLNPRFAFGTSVLPAQQFCSGFVLQMPATQAAAPPCVVVSSNT